MSPKVDWNLQTEPFPWFWQKFGAARISVMGNGVPGAAGSVDEQARIRNGGRGHGDSSSAQEELWGLCAARGDDVTIAIANPTNGDVGSCEPDVDGVEIAQVRRAEAQASADVIGASLIWMGLPDEFLFNDRACREPFIDTIRQARPSVMFIHRDTDYHPDHRVARDSRVPASVPLVRTQFPPTEVPTTFVMGTYKGRHVEPEVLIDITAVIKTKKAMLTAHESQTAWMQHAFGIDLGDGMPVQARFKGAQAGREFAEGFGLLHDWPYTDDWSLLP